MNDLVFLPIFPIQKKKTIGSHYFNRGNRCISFNYKINDLNEENKITQIIGTIVHEPGIPLFTQSPLAGIQKRLQMIQNDSTRVFWDKKQFFSTVRKSRMKLPLFAYNFQLNHSRCISFFGHLLFKFHFVQILV